MIIFDSVTGKVLPPILLDLDAARSKRYIIPHKDMFTGEWAEIVRENGDKVVIKLPMTPYFDQIFVVDKSCLIYDYVDPNDEE